MREKDTCIHAFPKALSRKETKTSLFGILTWVAYPISYDNDHKTKHTSVLNIPNIAWIRQKVDSMRQLLGIELIT